MLTPFIARKLDADCSQKQKAELKLCMEGACAKRLDEAKWSETRDETPRPFELRPRRDRDTQFSDETLSILSETRRRRVRLKTETWRLRPHPRNIHSPVSCELTTCPEIYSPITLHNSNPNF